MTVGDVININMSGTDNYQPAAGVEIMVLKTFMGDNGSNRYGFTDGTQSTNLFYQPSTFRYDQAGIGTKFGITNSQYYYNTSTAAEKGFSGIQIK
jgi:hypothetical protein